MKNLCITLLLATTPALAEDAPTPAAKDAPSLSEMNEFIFAKLGYDLQYFSKVEKAQQQGRTLPGTTASSFGREVTRARRNLPVLRRFEAERAAYAKGKPFTVPGGGATYREYRNLITLLNMFQAHAGDRADEVIAAAANIKIRKPEDLGRVRGAKADYYIAMYRAYFYLVGSAHYAKRHDQRAVEWFARLEADANLAGLKEEIGKEEPPAEDQRALELESLRTRPVALMPFVNNTGKEDLGWVGSALLEVLTVDLAQNTDLVIVERAQIDKVMEETALALGGFVEAGKASEVGQALGAGTLLVGAYQPEGDKFRLTMRLVAAESNLVAAAANTTTTEAELFGSARKLVLELLDNVGWDDAALPEDLLGRHAPTANTAQKLHQARLLMSTKQDQAKALYAKAIKEDPALANLYDDLKKEFEGLSATVAVMPFTNISGRQDDAWMVRGVVEALSTDLPALDFNVTERSQVAALMEEKMKAENAFLDATQATELGAALSADYVLVGGLLHQAPTLRLDARFVEVRTGLIVFATSAENKRDDLNAAIVALTSQLAERFNRPLDDKTIDGLLASKMNADQFKELARQQLAKDALEKSRRTEKRAEDKVAEAEANPAPADPKAVLTWSAAGGVVGGAALAATGFLAAVPSGDRAQQLHGVQAVVVDPAVRDDLRQQRDDAALVANVWTTLGYVGTAVAVASAGWFVWDGLTEDTEPAGPSEPVEAVAGSAR